MSENELRRVARALRGPAREEAETEEIPGVKSYDRRLRPVEVSRYLFGGDKPGRGDEDPWETERFGHLDQI
jgi:hypothetical protein